MRHQIYGYQSEISPNMSLLKRRVPLSLRCRLVLPVDDL